MDYRLILAQSIALIYWESLEGDELLNLELIERVMKQLPNPDALVSGEADKENYIALRDILLSMISQPKDISLDLLLSKLKISIKHDSDLRKDIEGLLKNGENQDYRDKKIKALQDDLWRYLHQAEFKDYIKDLSKRTLYSQQSFDIMSIADEAIGKLTQYIELCRGINKADKLVNQSGDIEDMEALVKLFSEVQDDLSPDSVIKTGWQGFNRMLGEVGGLRRGNMYVLGAMPNKGKSYVSSLLVLHAMLFNTPFMFDETKKPCVVHISTENDLQTNLKIWYRYLYENYENQVCNIQETEPEFMAKYFNEKITQNGYTFKFYYIKPEETRYTDILDRLKALEKEGYEIHMVNIDYLAMIQGDGLGDANKAFWVRQLFKVIRSYCTPRKITMITPHQVATDAAQLIRAGTDDFVKQIAGKRYWADCKSIDMEVDCEVMLNVEKGSNGESYMAFGRGKDRSALTTPEKDKFFFLPFSPIGGLRWDTNGKDTSRRSIREDLSLGNDWDNGSNDSGF